MVQRSDSNNIANVEVNNNTYIYYLMNATTSSSSNSQHNVINKNEQADVDSIDSGTCSDNSQKTSPIPPPLPAKKGNNLGNGGANGIIATGGKMTTKIVLNSSCDERNFSSSSDSDESDESLSSLCSNTTQNSDPNAARYSLSYSLLPDSLLKDIRDHSINTLNRKFDYKSRITINQDDGLKLEPQEEEEEKVKEKEENENFVVDLVRKNKNTSNTYETDKYYNFHINEHDAIHELPPILKNPDYDETFAGYKEIKSGCSTIRSAKGTIRGVKNRVRNGIATFLQIQQHTNKVSLIFFLKFVRNLKNS